MFLPNLKFFRIRHSVSKTRKVERLKSSFSKWRSRLSQVANIRPISLMRGNWRKKEN
jgi:hypothetical protein